MTKHQETYDIVLANGRVIDPETYLDATMHVGIKGGSIAAVSETPLEGKDIIDASGQIVAPGFIDMHAHGQDIPSNRMQAFDGCTTAMDLESGVLPVREFYKNCEKEGRPLNYGVSAAWHGARILVKNPEAAVDGKPVPTLSWIMSAFKYQEWMHDTADDRQVKEILSHVEEGLKEGALGIGIGYGYAPGAGSKEMVAVCQLAAEYGLPTYTHVQNMGILDPKSAVESYLKLIGLAAGTGAHMHICHLNSTSARDVDKAAPIIKKAIEAGLPISMGAYTYGTAESGIGAEEWNPDDVQERIGVQWSDLTRLRDMHTFSSKEEFVDARKTEPQNWVMVRMLHEEEDTRDLALLDMSVLFPGGVIETDGVGWLQADGSVYTGKEWPLPDVSSHPRAAGCYTRFLRSWVRERGVISYMDAIRKAALNPAQILEKSTPMMKKKGRIQVGADADVIVFDPETVADRATFKEPCQTSVGMKHVLVNGTFLIRDEQLDTEAFPGRAVRRPVTA